VFRLIFILTVLIPTGAFCADGTRDAEFFERKIRPLLIKRCYKCHSESAKKQEGGLLLDRRSGWIQGGDTGKAVLPGEPNESLLIKAVRHSDEIQMPPETKLAASEIALLETWVRLGAPGPKNDLGETAFSRLGDQDYLFEKAENHWSFQPVEAVDPPEASDPVWNQNAIDRFVYHSMSQSGLTPSRSATPQTLIRRLTFDLTGLPPTPDAVRKFVAESQADRAEAVSAVVEQLIKSPAFGEHVGRLWLDVARYADTDSFYRPDTRTPHYFPFAFTYRDYVIDAFNSDKPFDEFVREQFAADLMGFNPNARELAALGFLTVGPHANRNPLEALDDWIDVTTRGLLGMTAACARCHDHKYEPIPTADYYSLRGIFASVIRPDPLDETKQPQIQGYNPSDADKADYQKKRAAIDKKIKAAAGKKAKGNNRAVSVKIRQTELAQLLLFHPGAPARAMTVIEKRRPVDQPIYLRGDAASRGTVVPRRFLKILDPTQPAFDPNTSGRLELAEKIVAPSNPLTTRVFVNRVWGFIMGSHLVATPSDFGLQGAQPSHPELLDWLADDFVKNGWSTKRLVRLIVSSKTYQQRSDLREDMASRDPQNRLFWRANRKHLSIEAIRDSVLSASGKIDRTAGGRASELWGDKYTPRRAIYGYINRFNLDPTLRAFDFPTPMQTQPGRDESIVATQVLFTMNSPFVIDQAESIIKSESFVNCDDDNARIADLFLRIYQRKPATPELSRIAKFIEQQSRFKNTKNPKRNKSAWSLLAQSMMMSNEFQYID
jgi:hypothetical protein